MSQKFTKKYAVIFQLPCWGKTENGTPSDVLLHADLPYIDYDHCIDEVPPVFQHYVTRDKFCSGFSNGKCQII